LGFNLFPVNLLVFNNQLFYSFADFVFSGQGCYFAQTPQVFQGAQSNRSLVTIPATAFTPATRFINTSPISAPSSTIAPSSAVTGSVGTAPPLEDKNMEL
jgi:hypothetical protein